MTRNSRYTPIQLKEASHHFLGRVVRVFSNPRVREFFGPLPKEVSEWEVKTIEGWILIEGIRRRLEARFERQLRGMHGRSKEAMGSFQDYARAILKREGVLPEVNLRAVLRDPGTSNLYQRYLDFRLFGPLLSDTLFPGGRRDRRG